jgi:hypothetical protein
MVTPPPPEAADDAAPGDEVGLDPAVVARALAALDAGDTDAVRAIARELHYSELAQLFGLIRPESRPASRLPCRDHPAARRGVA